MVLQNGDFGIETSIYAIPHQGRFVNLSFLNSVGNTHFQGPRLSNIFQSIAKTLAYNGEVEYGQVPKHFENNFHATYNNDSAL